MLQTFCEFAPDYPAHLRELKDPLKLRSVDRIIQFPFAVPVVEEKTEEELAKIAERKKEQGRKLQEMAAKSRMEKVRRWRDDRSNGSAKYGPACTERERATTLVESEGEKGR